MNIRVTTIVFKSNPNITVVVNYGPVNGSKWAEEQYGILTNVINHIPKHYVIIESGDFNVHLGTKKSV